MKHSKFRNYQNKSITLCSIIFHPVLGVKVNHFASLNLETLILIGLGNLSNIYERKVILIIHKRNQMLRITAMINNCLSWRITLYYHVFWFEYRNMSHLYVVCSLKIQILCFLKCFESKPGHVVWQRIILCIFIYKIVKTSLNICQISGSETILSIPLLSSSWFSSAFYMLATLPSMLNILPHLIFTATLLVWYCYYPILQNRELCQRKIRQLA